MLVLIAMVVSNLSFDKAIEKSLPLNNLYIDKNWLLFW